MITKSPFFFHGHFGLPGYAKLSAGGTAYDLAQPTDYIVPLMIRQGLLQELDHAKMPNMKNFDENWMNQEFDPGNKYSVPYLAGTDAIVVNTDTVENVPDSWADLWDPVYAGRMIFLDDSRAVIGATLLTLGYDVNTTDPAQLEEAKAKLAELVPNIRVFDSDSPKTALIAGDVDLGMTWTFEALAAQQENPAIQYIYPTEGAILWQDNWVMLKDATLNMFPKEWLTACFHRELSAAIRGAGWMACVGLRTRTQPAFRGNSSPLSQSRRTAQSTCFVLPFCCMEAAGLARMMAYQMHPLDSFQIDEPEDIPFIELLMELRLGCARTAASR